MLIIMPVCDKHNDPGREKKMCGRAKGMRSEKINTYEEMLLFLSLVQKTQSRLNNDVFMPLVGTAESLLWNSALIIRELRMFRGSHGPFLAP